MRQCRIATLTAPFPAANGQKMRPMRAVDLGCHGRHEGASIRRARDAAPALERGFEKGSLFVWGIEEEPGSGVAMI